MGEIKVESDIRLDKPFLIEGFPGTGLVAKISSEYLIEALDLEYYGFIESGDLPEITIFSQGDYGVKPGIRLYASKDGSLVVLNVDMPVSAGANDFIDTVHKWMKENSVTPIYQVGLPVGEGNERPEVFGISTGEGSRILEENNISLPPTVGAVSGPTGALLRRARKDELSGIGLIVESDSYLPDPGASKAIIDECIEKIVGLEVDTSRLEQTAEQIKEQKRMFAEQMREAERHEATEAFPNEMYG